MNITRSNKCEAHYHYITYSDGGEELYDMKADPNSWTNLAHDANFAQVKAEMKKWVPKVNAPSFPGNVERTWVKKKK